MIRHARFSSFVALSAVLSACSGAATDSLDGPAGRASTALDTPDPTGAAPDPAAVAAGTVTHDGTAVPLDPTRADPTDPLVDLVIGAGSSQPMTFRVLQSQLQKLDTGFHVSGTIRVETPAGEISLLEADATFELVPGSTDIRTLHGSARVPFSDFGLSSVTIDAPSAQFGIDTGANLANVDAPLQADRSYLYFQFSDKLEVDAGPLTISAPDGQSHTVVVDPSDPFFFVRADLSGLGRISDVLQNVGIGVSMRGHIPFTPKDTWGITGMQPLDGHFYLDMTGAVKLADLPVSLKGTGDTVINIDPLGNGQTIFQDPSNGIRIGTNRQLDLSLDLIPDVAALDMELGEASMEADLLPSAPQGWVSGIVYPGGKSILSDVVGIVPASQMQFAAYLKSPLSDSYLDMAGDVTLDLSKLGDLVGLSIEDVGLGAASLHAAKDGASLDGRLDASFLTGLGVGAGAHLGAKFAGNPANNANWYVEVDGALSVSGVDLSSTASARLSQNGLHVLGSFATPLGQSVHMEGDITRQSFAITGAAEVTIPIANLACSCNVPKMCDQDVLCQQAKQCEVPDTCTIPNTCRIAKTCAVPRQCPIPKTCSIQNCTSSCSVSNIFGCIKHIVTCTTQTVTDAAKCGTTIVTDAAKCGTQVVTSASLCGMETVTDTAKCGSTTVTDAGKCGYKTVRDAALCGSDWVKCGTKKVQCGTTEAVGAACGSVCDGQVTQNLGSFHGTVTLTVDSNGLGGTVEGDYVNGGVTQHLAGGRLDLSSTPAACITIPGLGEFCHQF